jgi:hypothetical protein
MTEYRFYRESTGQWENVQLERWRWVATYTDGTKLHQFDNETKLFHQFREIEQDRLHSFSMTCDGKAPILLHWKPSYKLIHFYMRYRSMTIGNDTQKVYNVYCFGYEEAGHKVIMMIMPDDGIVITDDHNKVKVS